MSLVESQLDSTIGGNYFSDTILPVLQESDRSIQNIREDLLPQQPTLVST